jgi:hypothetical protein
MTWAALALAACMPTEVPAPLEDACGASGLNDFIGQGEDALAATTFPGPVRVIRPGQAITMDYSPARLNFDLDAQGRIVRIWCG